uniref:BTB domain-containing protein n=1 Tax=Panagrolaimus sp. ES5 TaxID=591445 RepID=A0AC34GCA6_9BILA
MPKDMNIHASVNTSCKTANFSNTWSHFYIFSEGRGPPLCSYDDLIDPTKKFIAEKKLIINVTATLKVHEDVTPIEAKKSKNEKSLGFMLWESEGDKDVSIVVDNKNELKAHKCVLKRRSSKFATLLDVKPEPSTSAKTESKIVVQNKAFKTVKEAIMHCYDIQNSDTLSAEDAANILAFASEYEIEDLKENMGEFCIENLSVSNACFFANCSITAKSDNLKNACFGFLANCMKTE